MPQLHPRAACLLATVLCCTAAPPALAAPVLLNGGFEAGFTGWTRASLPGSAGGFALQTGAASPVLGDPVPAPPQGSSAAMTDADAPGAHVLYQDFTATAGAASLSFQRFIGNRAPDFAAPDTLDFATAVINQQARADILRGGADPFSLAAGDILLTLFTTPVGSALVDGWSTVSADISALLAAHAGQSLRLRFAEADNFGPLQLGVDDVRITAAANPVPEPGSLALAALALLALAGCRRLGLGLRLRLRPTLLAAGAGLALAGTAQADSTPATVLDPTLQVTAVLSSGLAQPIGIVFLDGAADYLVLEKASGQVKRVRNGVIDATPVLDLAVNSASERGLLSLALHPQFPSVPWVYVRWTQSSSGTDSSVLADVPLLGNRVDRFVWNGSSLSFDRNIVQLRARQTDNVAVPGQTGPTNPNENGNHNGGPMRFGPDGKLHVFVGDLGRRGWLQNLANGPFLGAPQVDDTFGGPEPDDAHLSGAILRLNDDGSSPADNPFFAAGASVGGALGANLQKLFSYGHRNGFGMAFDPASGRLWASENADDAYAEVNQVVPGMNGGWIQFAGPMARVRDWKTIEMTQYGRALQQLRYPPSRAVYTPAAAAARLVMLPGAVYKDPELSWRYETGPSGAAFVGNGLGAQHEGSLWMGSARSFAQVGGTGGSLYRLRLAADRRSLDLSADPRLADRVADNLFRAQKFEGSESETLIIGTGFGTVTDLQQARDGSLYVVSLTDGTIYRISRAP